MISFTAKQKKRAWYLLFMLFLALLAMGLILYALSKNINLYYTPTEIHLGKAPLYQKIRVGGLVRRKSIQYEKKQMGVNFVVTDIDNIIHIHYQGALPDLFAEGRGVIVEGQLKNTRVLLADRVLAKHDEKYMPKEVVNTLKKKQLLT